MPLGRVGKPEMALKFLIAVLLILVTGNACAKASHSHSFPGSHSINSHVKKNGFYVASAHATNLNVTQRDNFSNKGNVNPYTGKPWMKDPAK